MKRALAILAVASMFGFAGLAQGTLTGQWDFDFTLGMRDVVITDPGATITIAGGTYPVSQGLVTIPDKTVTVTVAGQDIPLTVPGGTYICNGSLTIPGGTFDVTAGTVTIPSQDVPVTVPGGTYTCTIPSYSFEIPEITPKTTDIKYPVEDKDILVTDPEVLFDYSGTVEYHYVVQTGSRVLQEDDASFDLANKGLNESGTVPDLTFHWDTLTWSGWPATVTLPGKTDVDLYPEPGKHFQVDFSAFTVTVKCDDALEIGTILIEGRTATGKDSNGNDVTITLKPHYITFSIKDPKFTLPQNYAYAVDAKGNPGFEGHNLAFEIPETVFDVTMPAGWPWCEAPSEFDRPTVSLGWDNIDVYVYQITNTLWAPGNSLAPEDLDKLGLAYVTLGPEDYDVLADGSVEIGFGEIEGTANLGAYYAGTTTITIPEHTCTITIEDKHLLRGSDHP